MSIPAVSRLVDEGGKLTGWFRAHCFHGIPTCAQLKHVVNTVNIEHAAWSVARACCVPGAVASAGLTHTCRLSVGRLTPRMGVRKHVDVALVMSAWLLDKMAPHQIDLSSTQSESHRSGRAAEQSVMTRPFHFELIRFLLLRKLHAQSSSKCMTCPRLGCNSGHETLQNLVHQEHFHWAAHFNCGTGECHGHISTSRFAYFNTSPHVP